MATGTLLLVWLAMVATATLSGVFGMAGGMVLVGLLLVLLPLPEAMALHAVTQVSSNGWRAAFGLRAVRPRIVAAHALGCAAALGLWWLVQYVPEKGVALLALGLSPFSLALLPARIRPDPERPAHMVATGAASMSLMLLTGVAGPLLDRVFLGGRLDRHAIIATKALCQVVGHALKLAWFGALLADPAALDGIAAAGAVLASLLGTALSRPLLRAMSEASYRLWAGRIVTGIALAYLAQGSWLLLRG
jgi:uncharacterized membrane protein YfcA